MLHIFEPVEGRADPWSQSVLQRYGTAEDAGFLQATQLQSAIVKAMYAATIESDLDTERPLNISPVRRRAEG